jgi:5-methylthioadenosine/S-adenosylhomocysteine deaminase
MTLVVSGTVAPLRAGAEDEFFAGRVFLADDGTVAAVTSGNAPGPAGFDNARAVDVGTAVIYPGLVDLHSHLGYNTLPLWADPGQQTPYLHHDIWPGEPTYKPDVSWPAWTLAAQAPEALLTYVQVRCLAGGTTSVQGWPSMSRPALNRLVRCVDDDRVGPQPDPIRVSALTLEPADLQDRSTAMGDGAVFIYHCAEGQPGSIVAREFDDLDSTGCLQQRMVCVHTTALDATAYARWHTKAHQVSTKAPFGSVVWSPFSNLWLYGVTADVPAARAAGLTVCLGTDWGPSGTHNLLGELKVARLHSDASQWGLSDADLVQMVTCLPGDVLARAWRQPVGRLVPGALGDLVVVDQRGADPWTSLVTARERDVQLVVVGGRPVWGASDVMSSAGAVHTTAVRLGSVSKRVSLVRPDDATRTWTWTDVLASLDAVRANAAQTPPSGPAGSATGPGAAHHSADPPGTPPIAIALDMPGGGPETAGPPPKGQVVEIPPIEAVYHNPTWLRTIHGRGFHGGALDGLDSAFG